MQQMTIGQRIASRRKLLNLSQEALAEQLEVSRQAVSRWESDSAIPEIDKLIGLSRIFRVSIGWLLGTEQDPSFDPSTGLSDAQLKMVEQLLDKQHGKRKKVWLAGGALAVCILVAAAVFGIRYHQQMENLTADNADALAQIEALTENNEKLQSQLGNMNDLLLSQAEAEKLLTNVKILPFVSKDLKSIDIEFYCTPKMMPENAAAYISVVNPVAGVNELLQCAQSGNMYWVRTVLPPADGYRYSFLMVTESGFKEQILSKEGLEAWVLSNLDSAMHFTPDPESKQRSEWNKNERQYTFTTPVYMPLLPIAENPHVGYKDVRMTLRLNGNVVWEQSCKDAIRTHAGTDMRTDEPWQPHIETELPALSEGDELKLEVTVFYYDGQQMTSILETLNVK